MRLLWIVLGGMAIGLAVLFLVGRGGDVVGLDSDHFARLIYLGALLAVVSAGLVGSRITGSNAMRYGAIWLAIIVALVAGYQYRHLLGID